MLINKSQLKQRCQQLRNFSENADSMGYVLLEISCGCCMNPELATLRNIAEVI